MRLCIDLNSDLTWEIEDFLIISHQSDSEMVINYYEYKIKTNDGFLIRWLCQEHRDLIIYLGDKEEKYHELSGCSGIQESDDIVSVKIWFYRTGIKNLTKDRVSFIEHKVLTYQRNQTLQKLDII